MKTQNYLSRAYNTAGAPVDFERWSYAKIDTVKRALIKLYNNSLYYTCSYKLDGARYIIIFDNNDQAVSDKIYITDLLNEVK